MNYRELRLLIRKLIKETSLLPGMETPSDLNPAFKRDDWNMSNMKPDQHVAFTIDVNDKTHDEFLDLFGKKIEFSGDWIVASPKTADYIKKFIEREGGRFNLAPEEIVDWIIRNPDNNIVVEGFMGGSGSDGNATLTNTSTDETSTNPGGTGATNDGTTNNPENVEEDKKNRHIKAIADGISTATGIDNNIAVTIALYLADQPGADTKNPHEIVSNNTDLFRRLQDELGLTNDDDKLSDPKFIEALTNKINK